MSDLSVCMFHRAVSNFICCENCITPPTGFNMEIKWRRQLLTPSPKPKILGVILHRSSWLVKFIPRKRKKSLAWSQHVELPLFWQDCFRRGQGQCQYLINKTLDTCICYLHLWKLMLTIIIKCIKPKINRIYVTLKRIQLWFIYH